MATVAPPADRILIYLSIWVYVDFGFSYLGIFCFDLFIGDWFWIKLIFSAFVGVGVCLTCRSQ